MNQKRSLQKTMAWSVALIATLGLVLDVIVSPETALSYRVFRLAYGSSISKQSVLETYRSNLWSYNGGKIPELTDRFLCSRLESDSPSDETKAIVDFYTLQAGGREGKTVISLPDKIKEKVIGRVMQDLEGYDEPQAGRALLLVEELRRGAEVWKGSFGPLNPAESANWSEWWRKRGLDQVKALYREWWQSPAPWSTKKTQNPLAGSGIEAEGP